MNISLYSLLSHSVCNLRKQLLLVMRHVCIRLAMYVHMLFSPIPYFHHISANTSLNAPHPVKDGSMQSDCIGRIRKRGFCVLAWVWWNLQNCLSALTVGSILPCCHCPQSHRPHNQKKTRNPSIGFLSPFLVLTIMYLCPLFTARVSREHKYSPLCSLQKSNDI